MRSGLGLQSGLSPLLGGYRRGALGGRGLWVDEMAAGSPAALAQWTVIDAGNDKARGGPGEHLGCCWHWPGALADTAEVRYHWQAHVENGPEQGPGVSAGAGGCIPYRAMALGGGVGGAAWRVRGSSCPMVL